MDARLGRRAALLGLAALGARGARAAPPWPVRPVRYIVPYPAGGGADTNARIFVPALNEQPGAPQLVIDNRGGAGGTVGAELLARATPDGATLGQLSIGTHGSSPAVFARLGYDPIADFTPVALIGRQPVAIAVAAGSPIRSLDDLLAARQELSYGSSGTGTTGHLVGELVRARSGLALLHVPYRGAGPAWADLIGGRIALAIDNIHIALPHHLSGRVRIIALSGERPSPLLPEVPVLLERLAETVVYSWNGIAGPAGLPAPLVGQLHDAMQSAWRAPELRRRYDELGIERPEDSTPANFADFIRRELAFWRPIVAAARITPD